MVDEVVDRTVEMTQPIVIDLGRQKNKAIKDLKDGKGQLWDDMLEVVEEVKERLGEDASGKIFVPIVMVYKTRPKRRRINKLLFPGIR